MAKALASKPSLQLLALDENTISDEGAAGAERRDGSCGVGIVRFPAYWAAAWSLLGGRNRSACGRGSLECMPTCAGGGWVTDASAGRA
jgi:hypothetical protein